MRPGHIRPAASGKATPATPAPFLCDLCPSCAGKHLGHDAVPEAFFGRGQAGLRHRASSIAPRKVRRSNGFAMNAEAVSSIPGSAMPWSA